jgi:hypothetical protein
MTAFAELDAQNRPNQYEVRAYFLICFSKQWGSRRLSFMAVLPMVECFDEREARCPARGRADHGRNGPHAAEAA